jgi:hypothetical protein
MVKWCPGSESKPSNIRLLFRRLLIVRPQPYPGIYPADEAPGVCVRTAANQGSAMENLKPSELRQVFRRDQREEFIAALHRKAESDDFVVATEFDANGESLAVIKPILRAVRS